MDRARLAAGFAAALAGLLVSLLAAGPAGARATLAPYRGFATWVDLYDQGVWRDPEAAVTEIAARGVRTIFAETGSYRTRLAIPRRVQLGQLLEAAHARGVAVVAWYLPSFRAPAADAERSLAAVRFRSPAGQRFDGFALDIESTEVRSAARRTRRLLQVAASLRAGAGRRYVLGAIVLSPRGLELSPAIWPGFPYRDLAASFDVFLPMAYFTYRTQGRADTRDYVAAGLEVLRRETGEPDLPIHVVGGVADRASLGQVRGFADAVCAERLLGASVYDFATTSARAWSALARAAACVSP